MDESDTELISHVKWISHKIITGAAVYAITGNIVATIPAIAGSIFPDVIEGMPDTTDESKYNEWRKQHRKLSHWFVIYLHGAVVFLFLAYNSNIGSVTLHSIHEAFFNESAMYPTAAYLLGWFCIGCLMHIAQDAVSGKVPSLNPKKRIGVRLFSVGSIMEYIVVIGVLAILISYTSLLGGLL